MISLDVIERLTLALGVISGIVTIAIWCVRTILKIERRQDELRAVVEEIRRDVKTLL